jgi:GNS1/SUR4 family
MRNFCALGRTQSTLLKQSLVLKKVLLALFETENFNVFCIPAPWNDYSAPGLKILHLSHAYYLIKILDLLDTVFFVLRKKNGQVTFLHIYHHTVMVFGGFLYIKFMSGGGHALVLGELSDTLSASRSDNFTHPRWNLILGLVNAFVHVIMYGYYFLTSFKPELKQSIWWKKYITQVQMAQFAILIVHFSVPVFTACSYPKGLNAAIAVQNIFMLLLFGDFYYKAYVKTKSPKA